MKGKVHSPDGDADFFNIVGGVLQGDTFYHIFLLSTLATVVNQ